MNVWPLAASGTPSPAPTIEIDPPDLAGDPTQWIWWQDLLTGPVLRIGSILVMAFVARVLIFRAIDGFTSRIGRAETDPSIITRTTRTARAVIGDDIVGDERRATRATSLGALAKNVINVIVLTIAIAMILDELGFHLGPLLAGAGVVGVALGFGAQTVVADFLSGVFMLLEDQYGVGDTIDIGPATGIVEDVHLRVTRLRSVDGTVWYVRNGEVVRVGNMSQNWSRALLDIGVAYSADVAGVRAVMLEEATALAAEQPWDGLILEEPEVWGVQDLAEDAVVIRVVIKTQPGEQWAVARELRERIKSRFDRDGIEIPFPQRTVWVRREDAAADTVRKTGDDTTPVVLTRG